MKQAGFDKSVGKANAPRRFGLQLLIALLVGGGLWVAIAPQLRLGLGNFTGQLPTGLDAPYRYPFSQSLPSNGNPAAIVQREIAFYQERISRDPTGGLNRAALAGSYLKMARATGESSWYLLAEQAAQRSLAHLPFENDGAVVALARVAEARHDFSAALRWAARAPNHEDALGIQVTANLALGRVDQAAQAANALVEGTPTLAALTLQALVQNAQGQDAAVLQTLQQALATEEPGEPGGSAWARTLLGRFYAQRGNPELAAKLYRQALNILPRYPLALVHLAELETRLGQYRAAEQHYAQVLSYPKGSSTVFDHVVLRGQSRLKALQGDAAAAREWQDKAEKRLRQDLTAFGHRRELARLLLERGQSADLVEALSLMRAEVQVRQDAPTLDTLAWSLSRLGRWREAQAAMRQALRWGARDAGLFYRAGRIEQALGNPAQAQAFFQAAQATDPRFDLQARQALGLDWSGVGD